MTRQEKLKKRMYEVEFYTKKEWWGEGLTILDNEDICKEPLIVRKAYASRFVLENMPAELKPDELITGICRMSAISFGHTFPQYAFPEEIKEAAKYNLSPLSVWGHQPPDYETVLKEGLVGIRARIHEQMDKPEHQEKEQQDFYRAMLIALEGMRNYALRYRDMNLEAAENETDPVRKKELRDIAKRCERVPEHPATSFAEALQCVWFVYLCLQSNMENISLARADQYLYPYYKKDIEEKVIDEGMAGELLSSFLVKFNERVQMNPEHWEDHVDPTTYSYGSDPNDSSMFVELDTNAEYNYGITANHWDLNVILSGTNEDGSDATNDLTYLFLKEWAYLEVIAPVVSVRFSEHAPERLVETCADILRCGSGEPVIYNDKPIIEGLHKLGIPLEEARGYSNDGCWETLIPGKTHYSYGHIEVLQLLEYALNRGMSLVRKRKEAPDYGDPCSFKTYEELYEAFRKQMDYRCEKMVENRIRFYGASASIAPDPLNSAIIDGCIESGKDLTAGGAKYTIFSPLITGFSYCVDALAAIKKLVYEEKKVSMETLIEAMKNDFEGQEPLRQMLMNRAPKFGNDDEYADSIARQIIHDAEVKIDELAAEHIDVYMPMGIGTFESYSKFGHSVGASASGRHAQEPVASNYSPSFGADKNGPTAAIKSIMAADISKYVSGCPLDMQVNSNETAGPTGLKRLCGLIRTFLDLGGIMLTITGVNTEMLRDAQENPDRYKSLRVRMGGLSAYFVALPKEMQETLISKTKYNF